MIKTYIRILKRELRSKKFLKKNKIKILSLNSYQRDLILDVMKKIIESSNKNIEIYEETINFIEEIENKDLNDYDYILIPSEALFISFLLFFSFNKFENLFKNFEKILGGYISLINLKKEKEITEKYKEFYNFVKDVFSRDNKYSISVYKSIEYIIKKI